MKDTIAQIALLLMTRYQVAVDPSSASFKTTRLGELDLDSLSLLSFLADIEREFRLCWEELEQIARRDCTLGRLSTLCGVANRRAIADGCAEPA